MTKGQARDLIRKLEELAKRPGTKAEGEVAAAKAKALRKKYDLEHEYVAPAPKVVRTQSTSWQYDFTNAFTNAYKKAQNARRPDVWANTRERYTRKVRR